MEKRQYIVYKFGELPKEARERAIEKYRFINVEGSDDWSDDIKEEHVTNLKRLGYENIVTSYSGFGSQGDGACFEAKIDIAKWLKAHRLAKKYNSLYKNAENVSFEISHSFNQYHYATSTDVDYEVYVSSDVLDKQADEIAELIEAEREAIGDAIYGEIEKRYFTLIGDVEVEDTLIANDYWFTIDGEID